MTTLSTAPLGPTETSSPVSMSLASPEASSLDFFSFLFVQHVIAQSGGGPPLGVPLPRAEHLPKIETSNAIHTSIASTAIEMWQVLPEGKIGIIGAGAAGLYAAMILQDLGIDYEILEASNRTGGRIFTHRFNGKAGKEAPIDDPARYDYFDVGAMRFPHIVLMDRVFDLFDRIGIQHLLKPYKFFEENNLMYYNNIGPITKKKGDNKADHFNVAESKSGPIPDEYADLGAKHWIDEVYRPFREEFKKMKDIPKSDVNSLLEPFEKLWKMITAYDHLSMRSYLLSSGPNKPKESPGPFPQPVIDWLETFDAGTGWYDGGFVESVMHALDFGTPAKDPKAIPAPPTPDGAIRNIPYPKGGWHCIDGGADHIIEGMLAKLKNQPIMGQKVTKISERNHKMVVECANGKAYEYAQVINTAPLGCIGAMDLEESHLLYSQKSAIRCLQYSASTKVALKFDERWWEDEKFMTDNQVAKTQAGDQQTNKKIVGGQSTTDLPIRCCVYPSYGLDSKGPAPGILLACYNWAQDASRIGALVGKGDEKELVELILDNIAKLHNIPREKIPPVRGHFAWNWSNDPHTLGAFAMFGPGQFGDASVDPSRPSLVSSYVSLKAPAAKGKLHFAGEATSIHHAWVQGALNSAWRAVFNVLNGNEEKRAELKANWGTPSEEYEEHLKALTILARAKRL
ncbi:FAD/NAD(P)-binding domain-containing protein [Serendipita vermifera]|nr:FAD/NAD(P)-binding domain-containing protein [Serendipita vermifera]